MDINILALVVRGGGIGCFFVQLSESNELTGRRHHHQVGACADGILGEDKKRNASPSRRQPPSRMENKTTTTNAMSHEQVG